MAITTMTDYFAPRDAYLTQFKITASYKDVWQQGDTDRFARMVVKFDPFRRLAPSTRTPAAPTRKCRPSAASTPTPLLIPPTREENPQWTR
jgi:hypothetical protein